MLVLKVLDDNRLQVIHYSADGGISDLGMAASKTAASSGFCTSAKLKEEPVDVNPKQEKVELLKYPEGVAIYTGQEAVERAKNNIEEQKKYNIFTNNCESFVNWVITDEMFSEQAQKVAVIGVSGAVGAGGGIGIGGVVGIAGAVGLGATIGIGAALGVVGGAVGIGAVLLVRKVFSEKSKAD